MADSPIILVHGAFHGSWCWHKVIPFLEAAGRQVKALDMPGRAGDTRPHTDLGLDDFAGRVCEALESFEQPAVVVGHSQGGLSITQAAERLPERINVLVYLAALMPKNGQTREELFAGPNPSMVSKGLRVDDAVGSAFMDDEYLVPAFYADCDEDDIALARANLVPEVRKVALTPVSITPERFGKVRRVYIECTQDQAVLPDIQRRMINAQPPDRVITMETSHSPFFSAPEALANHILTL